MDNQAIYHVARDGQVIGAFSFPTLAAKFKDGSVKPTDHYLIEGTSEWRPVSALKSQFADYEQEQATKAKRLKKEAEEQAAKEKALQEEANRLRREVADREAAKERAEKMKPKPWKCHTCAGVFTSTGKAGEFPEATGLVESVALCGLGTLFACTAVGSMFSRSGDDKVTFYICGLLATAAYVTSLGYLIVFGVEFGLQKFNSYRPRCPNCSSPYCSKLPE